MTRRATNNVFFSIIKTDKKTESQFKPFLSCRETAWKIHYILRTETGEFVDAETIADLTVDRLSAALGAVAVTDEKTYADVLYAGVETGLFNYEARFSLLLTGPVRQLYFAAFKSALITIWEQARSGIIQYFNYTDGI